MATGDEITMVVPALGRFGLLQFLDSEYLHVDEDNEMIALEMTGTIIGTSDMQ